jgi:CRISPR-associated exonuclease Cas4
VIVDWKSDVDPSDADVAGHARQLSDYVRAMGADRGLLIYMTSGVAMTLRPS